MKTRFYFISLAVLLGLSAYPLINGVKMAVLSVQNGALTPEQYAKYVVPYTAICVSVVLFAAFQPPLFKLRRFALPAGLAVSYGVFLAVERFFENIQIHTASMTLIDTVTLTPEGAGTNTTTADLWQFSLCAVSPPMREQSLTYASQDSFFYVVGNGAYKIHYYLISLLLITMVCGLVYSIGKALRHGGDSRPLILRGLSAAALVSLCVFANTTAFFRQAAPIQTPLASVLTCLFFVTLGASAGVYAGSYTLGKRKLSRLGLPVLLSAAAAIAMYAGEAAMMNGNLYRFGKGWFFDGLPGIALAPVDILVILLSGAATGLILSAAGRWERWPGKRTAAGFAALCAAVAVTGTAFSAPAPKLTNDDIFGCYVFAENIYTSPLSSTHPFGGLPYVYGFDKDDFIVADTGGGGISRYAVQYEKTPVADDEFSSKMFDVAGSLFAPPNMSHFKERYLLAVMSDSHGPRYGLYQMDGDLWLVQLNKSIWSIYHIKKTETTTLADLERALNHQTDYPPLDIPSPAIYANQMTLKDVYALARKGSALTLDDFGPYYYQLAGADFTARRYDVVGADTVFVHLSGDALESAPLRSRRTGDPSQTVDLRDGVEAVAAYLDPLQSFQDLRIELGEPLAGGPELLFDDDYFRSECLYYLDRRVAETFVTFENGERMVVKDALQERRINVEQAVARGLYGVYMVPKHNPLGGSFPILGHKHTFTLDDEAFYPSASFMYMADTDGGGFAVYYDRDELAEILEWYGHDGAAVRVGAAGPDGLTPIAAGNYLSDAALAALGIQSSVGWEVSSHTPVRFSTGTR